MHAKPLTYYIFQSIKPFHILFLKEMSSLRFPVIQTKKTVVEEEDYNFVNKDKKKKTQSGNPLELIEELKRKIDDQKKEIDNRNITIQGLQRNFESLSVIVKNQKALTATLRAQLENYKMNSETGDKRAAEFHQKCIMLQKQSKSLKQQLKMAKKAHSECSQYVTMCEELKKRIIGLQETNQKLHAKIMQADIDKKVLQFELAKSKSSEKDKRLMNERVIDLQEELKKMGDVNNSLSLRATISGEEVNKLKGQIQVWQRKMEELKNKLKESERQRQKQDHQVEFLKKENTKVAKQLEQYQKSMENKDLFTKLKQEDQQKLKKQYRKVLVQYNQLQENYKRLLKQSEQKSEMINFSHNEMKRLKESLQDAKQVYRSKENSYQLQIQKLNGALQNLHNQLNLSTGQSSLLNKRLQEQQMRVQNYNDKIGNLHDNIDQMNRKMQQHQQRYGHYLKLITANEPDVIITNERQMAKLENTSVSTLAKLNDQIARQQSKIVELDNTVNNQAINIDTMRKYITSLEDEVATKTKEIMEKNKLLRKFQDEEDELNRMIQNERKQSLRIKQEAEQALVQRMRELQHEKLKSQREIEEQKARLQQQLKEENQRIAQKLRRQQEKADRSQKLLDEYRLEEQKLKEMMMKQQQDLTKLSKEKQDEIKRLIKQKQDELERQKKNNKLLWSDNKKLKDLENQLREESNKQLQQKQAAKRLQLQRLKRQLQNKYKEELSSIKDQQSNTSQLKRILNQRTNQYKQLTQNFSKLKTESQFYKNRNKELQSLVSRLQKQFKDKTADLQRQNKSNKQVIEVLDKKLKDSESNVSQLQKKQKRQLKYLYDEIEQLKTKAKNQRIQQKVALVNKSMSDLDTSLKTLMNTMSCNYCVQVVKECVRLQCGHIYCKKCKGGYEPNCGECKKKSNPMNDRMIDDSVSKAQYMKILVNTIKDDLTKISG